VIGGGLAATWLMDWSLDLQDLKEDQSLRNWVSYRPIKMIDHGFDAERFVDFASECWQLCEPAPGGSFDGLDKHLLRIALRRVAKGRSGRNRMDTLIENINSAVGINSSLRGFLTGATDPDTPALLVYAARKKRPRHPNSLEPVFSRAFLMSRLAAAASVSLLTEVQAKCADVEFWWNPIGREAMIWQDPAHPPPLQDLWDDVVVSIDAIRAWRSANPGGALGSWSGFGSEAHSLSKFERALLMPLSSLG
jgi:hypothetical protein